jgi:hypothetical protein
MHMAARDVSVAISGVVLVYPKRSVEHSLLFLLCIPSKLRGAPGGCDS